MSEVKAGEFIFGDERLRSTAVFEGRVAALSFRNLGSPGLHNPLLEVKYDFTDSPTQTPVTIFRLESRNLHDGARHFIVMVFPENHYTFYPKRRALFAACGVRLIGDTLGFYEGWSYVD